MVADRIELDLATPGERAAGAGGGRSRFTAELDFEGRGIGKLVVPLVVRRQAARDREVSICRHSPAR